MKVKISTKIYLTNIIQTIVICLIVMICSQQVIDRRVVDCIKNELYSTSYLFLDAFSVTDDIGNILEDFHEKTGIEVTVFNGKISAISTIPGFAKTEMNPDTFDKIKGGSDYFTRNDVINGEAYYGYYIPVFLEDGTFDGAVFTGLPQETVVANIRAGVTVIVIAICIVALIFIGISYLTIHPIVKSIKTLDDTVSILSNNDLSVKHQKFDKPRDELQELCTKTSIFSENLGNIIEKLRETADTIFGASTDLRKSSEDTNNASNEIVKAVNDIAQGASSQAGETTDATEKISSIAGELHKINEDANELENVANIMNDIKNDAMTKISTLNKANQEIVTEVDSTNEQITITSNSVKKIQEAVNVIKNIAGQTRLLSLNANIEAARAGEAGAGFAVVASNIGELANQSANSSAVIDNIIQELTKNYTMIEESMKLMTSNVELQSQEINDTLGKFTVLDQNINDTVLKVNRITDLIENINTSIGEIVDNISNLSAISQENSAGTEETLASVDEQTASIEQIMEQAVLLESIADMLKKEVAVFKLPEK